VSADDPADDDLAPAFEGSAFFDESPPVALPLERESVL
jgi:hypothetical protein